MTGKFFVNSLGVFFSDAIDKENDYATVVYNPKEDKIIAVDRKGYFILKAIFSRPGSFFENLKKELSIVSPEVSEEDLVTFLQKMLSENIVFTSQ